MDGIFITPISPMTASHFLHSSDDFTEVVVRDSSDLTEVARLPASERVTNAIFSEDGRTIYAADRKDWSECLLEAGQRLGI